MKSSIAWFGLIAALGMAGCEGSAAPPAQKNPEPAIGVSPVEQHKLNTTVVLPAQVLAFREVAVYPKVTGFIESISVDRGSR
ncbi:MAG: hypothetical protein JO041_16645, partial [Acidobacteria bacterium]|nr:hypothetical protein [Acidobacteriota bacterium]